MTYNVFGGTLSLNQSISYRGESFGKMMLYFELFCHALNLILYLQSLLNDGKRCSELLSESHITRKSHTGIISLADFASRSASSCCQACHCLGTIVAYAKEELHNAKVQ